MSLALIQGYSSEEEAAGNDQLYLSTSDEDDDGDHKENHIVSATFSKPSFHAAKPPAAGSGSVLPSALDAFAEVNSFIFPLFTSLSFQYSFDQLGQEVFELLFFF